MSMLCVFVFGRIQSKSNLGTVQGSEQIIGMRSLGTDDEATSVLFPAMANE